MSGNLSLSYFPYKSRTMMPRFELLQLLFCLPLVLSYASFPLTAIPHYSELSPCAASYMGDVLGSSIYRGCTSATPISAYGSCLCAQRLSSINYGISFEFRFDAECSSTSVQSFVTAFCDRWGVDLAAKAGTGPVTDTGTGTTTAVGGNPTGSTDQGMFSVHGVHWRLLTRSSYSRERG